MLRPLIASHVSHTDDKSHAVPCNDVSAARAGQPLCAWCMRKGTAVRIPRVPPTTSGPTLTLRQKTISQSANAGANDIAEGWT